MENFSGPTTTIRIKKSLHTAAKAYAKKDYRSLRAFVERLISRGIARPSKLTRDLKEPM